MLDTELAPQFSETTLSMRKKDQFQCHKTLATLFFLGFPNLLELVNKQTQPK